MSGRRSNASVMGNHWEELGSEEPFAAGAISAGYRSSVAPSSVSQASLSKQRQAPPEHFDDANRYQGSEQDAQENVKVFIRVRPPLPRELNGYRAFIDVARVSTEAPGVITLCDAVETEDRDGVSGGAVVYSRQSFSFDHVYGPRATQEEVYERSARPAVLSVLAGYNATLIAYGQTGTGKTYTMEGFTNEAERGIIPRSVEEVFAGIRASRDNGRTKHLVRASYMQIYNEVISDLLVPPGSSPVGTQGKVLSVRHTPQRGVYIEGLSEWVVRTPRDVYGLIERGTAHRATSSTRMSELSSRSHAVFTIVVEVLEGDEDAPVSYRFGKLNIVDLAGSEKVRSSGVSGQRLEETKKINRSLHELGNVISALASKGPSGSGSGSGSRSRHIPFRNSVLTSALRDSLGGNCRTTLIACISPALESHTESLSTLTFANRAKSIRTTAVVNEDMDQAMLLRRYEKELKRLRELLREQQEGVGGTNAAGDASFMSQLEEGRQRAEEGKAAALAALQRSSQTCAQLELRIHELETMMDEGGFAGGPRTSEAYTQKLQELDRERLMMQEEKTQVDRYKQLLLKQRDIMLSLTTRLNERDETILQLQEEISAYDAHVALLEGQLDELAADRDADEGGEEKEGKAGTTALKPGGAGVGGGGRTGGAACGRSHAEAVRYLEQCRVRGGGGASSSPSQYRSDTDPKALLTAEEKLLEVLQTGAAPVLSALSSQLRLSEEELAKLRSHAKERLAAAASSAVALKAQRLQGEVEALALRLASSEGCVQLYDRFLDLHTQQRVQTGSPEEEEGLRRMLAGEVAAARQQWSARVEAIADDIAREKEERRRLAREVDRLRFELEQQEEVAHVTPSQRASVSRLWQALQALEGEVLSTEAAATPASDSSSLSAARALNDAVGKREKTWQRLLDEKQRALDSLLLRLSQGPSGGSDSDQTVAAKDAEVAALQRELTVQLKDRRALKTILDQRMKGKVDRIVELLKNDVGGANREKAMSEAKSLQSLLTASVKAMDS